MASSFTHKLLCRLNLTFACQPTLCSTAHFLCSPFYFLTVFLLEVPPLYAHITWHRCGHCFSSLVKVWNNQMVDGWTWVKERMIAFRFPKKKVIMYTSCTWFCTAYVRMNKLLLSSTLHSSFTFIRFSSSFCHKPCSFSPKARSPLLLLAQE